MRLVLPVLAALLALALLAPAAWGTTFVAGPEGPVPPMFDAVTSTSYVPLPPGPVLLHTTWCSDSGAPACARDNLDGMDELWFGSDTELPRRTLMHELGHIFDYEIMTDAARGAFLGIMGVVGPWRQDAAVSPHELFADTYSTCARHRTVKVGWPPVLGPVRFRRACRLIRQAAAGVFGVA